MSYYINEIFFSIQGEGLYSGTPAIFVRLSGCNLNCSFCDTSKDTNYTLSLEEVFSTIKKINPHCFLVTITGGEPTLQDLQPLVELLHKNEYKVHLETNGTNTWPIDFDFVTVSPKTTTIPNHIYLFADQLKILFKYNDTTIINHYKDKHHLIYIQPIDDDTKELNTQAALLYQHKHPEIRLSVQLHKLLGVK